MKIAGAISDLARGKRSKQIRVVRAWARTAPLKTAHAVTKSPDVVSRLSASASKSHLGEMTAQGAADHGLREWSRPWDARDHDTTDYLIELVNTVYDEGPEDWAVTEEGVMDEIVLPPLDASRLRR